MQILRVKAWAEHVQMILNHQKEAAGQVQTRSK